jgi:hypothetical protein
MKTSEGFGSCVPPEPLIAVAEEASLVAAGEPMTNRLRLDLESLQL